MPVASGISIENSPAGERLRVRRREKSTPTRPCQRCEEPARRLYRVRIEGEPWRLVCERCWHAAYEGRAGYAYGGTWTGRDRSK